MKMNLLSKFIFIYICIAVLGFLAVTFVSYRIDYKSVYEEQTEDMYRQAVNISYKYAPEYFSNENLRTIESELETVSSLNNTRIMFINTDGGVILDTGYNDSAEFLQNEEEISLSDTEGVLYEINDFNMNDLGSRYYQSGDFHSIFTEKTIFAAACVGRSAVALSQRESYSCPEHSDWTKTDGTFTAIWHFKKIIHCVHQMLRPKKGIVRKAIWQYNKDVKRIA